jgi:O-antigen/teichoic acid export membrane protein
MIFESSVLRKTLSTWFSGDNRTQKAFLNAGAGAVDYGARLVVGFLINPLLVAGLGVHGFGLWQVLRQLVGYASPASGRPTQALKWTIAKEQASTDDEAKRQYVGSTLVLWFVFLPILAAAGGLLAWLAPGWLNTPAELSRVARWAAGLLVANLILMTLVEIPRAVLAGENLSYKRMGLSAVLVFLGGGLTALALHLDTGLVGVAACPLVTTLLTGILFLRVVRRHVPWFGVARPSLKAVKGFFQLSGWFLVWRLVMQAMQASDLVLLGALDSVETVTTYALTKYVPETLVTAIAILVSAVTPGLGGILGAGDVERARRIRAEMMSIAWLISTVVGSTILVWNRAFVGLWVGPEYFAGSLPTLLIVLMIIQFVLIRTDANIIDLTLDLRNKVIVGVLSTALSVLLAALLVARFEAGIVGLCLGFIAGRVIISLAYPWMVGRVLRVPILTQLAGIWRPAIVASFLFFLSFRLGSDLALESWLDLCLAVAATLVPALGLAFFGGLSAGQRRRILQRMGR